MLEINLTQDQRLIKDFIYILKLSFELRSISTSIIKRTPKCTVMMNLNLRKNKTELAIIATLVLVFNIGMYLQAKGFALEFFDSDDYMRLVRTRDFFKHHDVYNNVIARCNVPYGCSLHWTRFYDFFIIVPSYLLSLFTESVDTAIEYIGFVISPIVKIITTILFFRFSQIFFKTNDAFLAAAIFVANPTLFQFGSFGRPDHHAFIMLFMVIFLGTVVNWLKSNFKNGHLQLALSSALCVWISPESLIPILLTDAVLTFAALFFVKNNDDSGNNCSNILFNLYLKNALLSCFVGVVVLFSVKSGFSIFLASLMSLVISSIFLLRKNPIFISAICLVIQMLLRYVTPIYYDEISVVHFSIFICMTMFFGAAANWKSNSRFKAVYKIVLAIIAAAIFLATYPKFLLGMGADVDPFIKEIWLNRIAEMQSPFELGEHAFYILHALIIIASVSGKITELYRHRWNDLCNYKTLSWIILSTLTIFYLVFSGFAYRMLAYSALFGTPLIVDFCMNGIWTKNLHRLVRIFIVFFASALFVCITTLFCDFEKSNCHKKRYSTNELFAKIDALSSSPAVIMAHSNDGAALLYYTKHMVVGAPYHRQPEGILSSYKVMEDDFSENTVKKILLETGSSFIFVRKRSYGSNCSQKRSKNSLTQMIIDGNVPAWISPVPLPEKFSDIIVGRVSESIHPNTATNLE